MIETRRVVVLMMPSFLSLGCGGRVVESVIESGNDPNLTSVVSFAEAATNACAIPGGAIAIVENGKLSSYAGFGLRDDTGNVVTPDTLFLAAGVSKSMVGAAALALDEQGKLALSAGVTDYVPLTLASEFDPTGITMQMLLTHTSGLPDMDTTVSCATGPGALTSWFSANDQEPLWSPPGEVWDFSQRGYAVAGWAIGAASGLGFEDAMRALVFAPAGMTSATYDPATVLATNHATGHHVHPDGSITVYDPSDYDCTASRPSMGIYASAKDLAHFVETLYEGDSGMMSASSVQAFETGQVLDELYPGDKDAYGMYVHEGYKGVSLLRTNGDTQGFDAALWMVPARRFAVVVMLNGYNHAGGCASVDIAEGAIDTYLGLTNVAPPDWLTPPTSWQPFVGSYHDPYDLGDILVTLEGANLVATTNAYGAVTLSQQSAAAFSGDFGGSIETVTFDPDKSGSNAAWFVTRLGVGKRQ